jgi:hypothetical protein
MGDNVPTTLSMCINVATTLYMGDNVPTTLSMCINVATTL